MNVLLVEPDKILAAALKPAFEDAGHDVIVRRTAQSALDSLDGRLPDVIVLEIQLDRHNGIEYLYELRSYAEWQSVPVIVHTKNQNALNAEFRNIWKRAGVKHVLYKPDTSAKQLIKFIESAFAKQV